MSAVSRWYRRSAETHRGLAWCSIPVATALGHPPVAPSRSAFAPLLGAGIRTAGVRIQGALSCGRCVPSLVEHGGIGGTGTGVVGVMSQEKAGSHPCFSPLEQRLHFQGQSLPSINQCPSPIEKQEKASPVEEKPLMQPEKQRSELQRNCSTGHCHATRRTLCFALSPRAPRNHP